ncbi:RHS domain-containing protein, partial [Salmonella enterica subsp. enterica serovar Senftenberg]
LTEVAVTRGDTVRRYGYVYDAPGRRVEKHELDAEGKPYNRTTFLWDGMRLAQECRLGRSSSLYIYSDQGSHEPLARVDRAAPGEADEVLYYHTDVNGAPEEMTDGGGNIVWEAGYQVWGNLTHEKETRPVQQNLRFQGQYLDRETGLHYNLYRFYDPDIGKFISGDPIGLRGGLNLYQYAPNPLSWIDPLGLAVTPLNKEGFYVYGLYKPGATEPYYVGHTEQNPLKREGQHAGTGRLGDAELRVLKGEDGKLTYSQAKGYEQAYREKYKTKTGFPGNVIEPIDKSRTDSRGKSHYRNYRAAAKEIGIKPTKSRGCI